MANLFKTGKWLYAPLMVLSIGILSIVLLLGIHRMSERQLLNAALVDATRQIQIDTLVFHLVEEEIVTGEPRPHHHGSPAEIDEAIDLADFIVAGSGPGMP